MKKLVVALTAVALMTGSASAADIAARPYAKAPEPPAPVANWTGCYLGGGGGYGLWNQDNTGFLDPAPPFVTTRTQTTATQTSGGRGYFGTVQGGCDYQFPVGTWNFVVGAFGDYDVSDMHGRTYLPSVLNQLHANEKLNSQWSVGGRVGWLVTPSLLTYVAGGYTEAKFDRMDIVNGLANAPTNAMIEARTSKGWFVGAGDEYALNFLPGLFWKTEYRFSRFDRETNPYRNAAFGGALTGFSYDTETWVHAVRSELVFRFNWAGPTVAKY